MQLIKVNGATINPDKIAMIERKTGERMNKETYKQEPYSGVTVHFVGGGSHYFDDPTGEMIECQYNDWYEDQPLPY